MTYKQRAHIVGAVAGDGHVVGDGAHGQVVVGDDALGLLAADDEGVALLHPGVGVLGLEAVGEELLEQAAVRWRTRVGAPRRGRALRRILEYIGRSNIFKKSLIEIKNEESKKIVTEIVHAVESLSRQKIGALIVIEKQTGLTDVLETGTLIDAEVSSELLINIFIPNTPLHDGAVIIKNERIRAAACFLPLTENKSLSKELGTRHRAALGISEKSDALTIVISEETGIISVAEAGELNRHIDGATLRQILTKLYASSDASIFNTWRNKYESD